VDGLHAIPDAIITADRQDAITEMSLKLRSLAIAYHQLLAS
jgi:hypothetical protein